MKRVLSLVLLLILATCLIAGCSDDGESDVEPVETITTGVNQEFTIRRQFDLNSGFIWRETYDEKMLELLGSTIDTEERDDTQIILLQVFRFKALKKGKTEITLTHRRETLEGPIIARQEVIGVNIK
jgi:hypothetical protein